MQLRRSARLLAAAGALLLTAPVLSSCGFDYATDRVYTPGVGTNDRDAKVDVLGAVVVSGDGDSGTLITTFSNNDAEAPATVESITSAPEGPSVTVSGFKPIEIPPGGLVNLAEADKPINVEGDFDPGQFLVLTFTFGDGTSTTLQMPSVPDCYEYAGLDATMEEGTPAEDCEPEPSEEGH